MSGPGRIRRSRSGASLGSGPLGLFFVDMFKRIPPQYRTQSVLGGLLSAVCAATLTVLALLELQSYLSVAYHSEVVFPGSIPKYKYNSFVSIRFNVTFPHLPCKYLDMDLLDVYGLHSIQNKSSDSDAKNVGAKPKPSFANNIEMQLYKWRVIDGGERRVGTMQEHEGPEDGTHEEIPYHHAAHQYRDVVPLTQANFDTFVQSKDVVLVDFYAPWCSWCQKLAPVWENFAHAVQDKDYADFVGVAKVDCTAETALCQRRRIVAYPSIFLYRDRNPNAHVPYQGARTTQAFLDFIEGLGVEADHKKEIEDMLDEVQLEHEAERRLKSRKERKQREARPDGGINHPLKSLTAPGSALGPSRFGSGTLSGVLQSLGAAGGSRGGMIRIFTGNGGTIRIVSVRRISSDDKDKNAHPLTFKSGRSYVKENDAGNDAVDELTRSLGNARPTGSGGISVKILPSAKPKNDGSEVASKPSPKGTVPEPRDAKAKKEAAAAAQKDSKVGSGGEKVEEKATKAAMDGAAKAEKIVEEGNEKEANGGGGGGRRRRLLAAEDGGDDTGGDAGKIAVADSELESRAELFKHTETLESKQKFWREKVLTLPEEQQSKFAQLVDGANPMVPEEKKEGPKIPEAERVASSENQDPHAVDHTEGCLVYGAVVAEKVPATLRFKARSKWHDFVGHHIDMSHTVHSLTFGDLTHTLQEEFAHIDFRQFEGTRMMTTLAPNTFTSSDSRATHHHYMRAVSTQVSLLGMDEVAHDGEELFQYTATSSEYRDTAEGVPSAKFTFDFDPMILRIREEGIPLHKFLVSLCAILGGVLVVFNMLNNVLSALLSLFGKND